ncbi:U-box domain-containing protein 34-like [Impatiens glandulifera]|uniref:U-box domain-containing protein 34-like n=1 Tax=Impatiens glandulifera TaxID=253017 RepID=UPI001FB06CD4|nr:U-box domain-containing protein 34-like [Impatiens glandulifera]
MGLSVINPPSTPSPIKPSRPELEDEIRNKPVNRGNEREKERFPQKLNSSLSNLPSYDSPAINLPIQKTGSLDALIQNLDLKTESEKDGNSTMGSVKDMEAEMKRLKMELMQTKRMFDTACKEAISEKRKADELNTWKKEEAPRIEKALLSEVSALASVEVEKAKAKTAIEAAEKAQKLAKLEKQKRLVAEMQAKQELEKRRATVSSNKSITCRNYTLEEIEIATDCFAESLKIGEGGYGPVFKGKLENTAVAIKVLRPDAKQGKKQFQREVEILSCIRHPNMVLLLGACPEYGSLVYEFMDYGSLEDRLYRRSKTPPIPWRIRFKIATDIATGLLFLHQTKPEPLVHRDLKPANILLNKNFVCKIGDVGLAHLVPASVANEVTQYHMTSAAGTLCYIDPEYQQTGSLGTKSDIYSLGIVLLQIITGRPPSGITRYVEDALEKGTLESLLDRSVSDWPIEETINFAKLALKCVELRKRDRPDLDNVVLPELRRISNMF